MVAVPVLEEEVYKPDELTEPLPDTTLQEKVGPEEKTVPNWSYAVAVNCCDPETRIVNFEGDTTTLVGV